MAALEEDGLLDRALGGAARPARSSPSGGARGAGWSGRSCRCCSPTRSAGWRALLEASTSRRPVARARPARLLPARRWSSASAHLLRRASAAARAAVHDQRQLGRQRARARRSSPRSSPSAACDPAEVVRAYRIAREVTGAAARWEAIEKLEGVEPRGPGRADGRRRRARRRATRWYLSWEPERRPGDDDRRRARGLRAARGGAARPRRRGAARAARRESSSGSSPPACPEELAQRRTRSRPRLVHAPDMIAVAAATGRALEDVARGLLRGRRRAAARLARGAQLDALRADVAGCSAGRCQAVREDARRRAASSPRRALDESPGKPPAGGRRALPAPRDAGHAAASRRSCARSRARASRTSRASRSRSASCARSSASRVRRGAGQGHPQWRNGAPDAILHA